ncbi:uncharacterized protein MYCFIDRAFT_55551 [Pseudocercospora fijiensis CIRAD86]|uniref:Uncharacterized protein n=1 Tax=Pseudocercospora fijiensis (strain CIRAD86) TaxID=383855 RepID=N1QCC6_PSEFD|nr:uncharacterized protein MYCFIDRAFT_55551 [Pseudocercospora fijiensis CIRAD86]EME89063.1 hypothetical protein MYCFIDRAFT_55551 [Pseudocercospora fijiensis CIRAD86]
MPRIVLLGTCDTKLDELLYLRSGILEAGKSSCKVILVDVGRSPTSHEAIDITQKHLTTKYGPSESKDVGSLPRGDVIKYMITCASNWLREAYNNGLRDPSQGLHGIVSAGGTGGTSLASGAMRASLPIGFPKLIVSTAASGDTGAIVEETDITLMYSVVDIAGTNTLLRRILSNAAGSIHGMAQIYEKSLSSSSSSEQGKKRKRVGLTMFGVTTPCVDKVRQYLESNHEVECFVFHCTGHGGKAMERLVEQGDLDAVLDITTTEICDYLAGGVMSAGEHRLEAALKAGIPYVVSVGAIDMVNFGPKGTVPERYQKAQRKLFEHNPTVTLMRTSPEECTQIGNFIVEKIQKFAAKKENVHIVLPLGGVSMIATPDAPFYDAKADEAIFSSITNGLKDSGVVLINDQRAINDEGFAVDIAKRLVSLMRL